jgi:hypothetical protein
MRSKTTKMTTTAPIPMYTLSSFARMACCGDRITRTNERTNSVRGALRKAQAKWNTCVDDTNAWVHSVG